LFSVAIPTATNFARVRFEILDFTGGGESSFDMVGFYVKDFGEARVASVTRIPQAALDAVAKADPKKLHRDVADKALWDWRHKFPQDPVVAEEEFIPTPYGQGIRRIYKAAKGSVIERREGGSGRGFEPFDVLIGVILVVRNDHYIAAIAQDDYHPLDGAMLRRNLLSFFSGMSVPDRPRFDSAKP